MKKQLLNTLPRKSLLLVKDLIEREMQRQRDLLTDVDNVPDEILAEFAYGNDLPLLQMVLDEINKENQIVEGELYVMSHDDNNSNRTLQRFGCTKYFTEKNKMVFLAKDFEEACILYDKFAYCDTFCLWDNDIPYD